MAIAVKWLLLAVFSSTIAVQALQKMHRGEGMTLNSGTSAASTARRSKRPHLIHIVVDDWGYNDVGFRDQYLATPTMDSLAKRGVIVEHFYVCPVCAPTRGALMTGRMPWRWGMNDFRPNLNHPYVMNPGEKFLAEELAESGQYRSAMVGKWDLGVARKCELPFSKGFGDFRLPGKPTQLWGAGSNHLNFAISNTELVKADGFRGYFVSSFPLTAMNLSTDGLWDIHDGVPCEAGRDGLGAKCDNQRKAFCNAFGSEYHSISEWVAPETPSAIQKPGTYSTDMWSDLAAEFIERHAAMNDEKGLYLYAAFTTVHNPMQAPHADVYGTKCASYPEAGETPQFTEANAVEATNTAVEGYPLQQCTDGFPGPCVNDGNLKRKILCGMLHATDRAVGKIVDALKTAGMWDDTVLLVMGDNGGLISDAASNYPFSGEKNTGWEGGVKVPAFWSGGYLLQALEKPHTSSNLHLVVDVHATFAGLAQIEPEKKRGCGKDYDGVDQWQGLISPSSKAPRTTAVVVSGTQRLGAVKVAIAHGDDGRRWKLMHNPDGWGLFGILQSLTECTRQVDGCDGLMGCLQNLAALNGANPFQGGPRPANPSEAIPAPFMKLLRALLSRTRFCRSLKDMSDTYDSLMLDGSKEAFDAANNATFGMLDLVGTVVPRFMDDWFLFDLDACADEGGDTCSPNAGGSTTCECNSYNSSTARGVQSQLEQALDMAEAAATESLFSPLGDPWSAFEQFDWFVNPWRDSNYDATLCTITDHRCGEQATWDTPRCTAPAGCVELCNLRNARSDGLYCGDLTDAESCKHSYVTVKDYPNTYKRCLMGRQGKCYAGPESVTCEDLAAVCGTGL